MGNWGWGKQGGGGFFFNYLFISHQPLNPRVFSPVKEGAESPADTVKALPGLRSTCSGVSDLQCGGRGYRQGDTVRILFLASSHP